MQIDIDFFKTNTAFYKIVSGVAKMAQKFVKTVHSGLI